MDYLLDFMYCLCISRYWIGMRYYCMGCMESFLAIDRVILACKSIIY